MKKFLSLVLALVMTASLVTVSAAETEVDFTDDSSITYEEAVDVMTAIGVVGGYTDGSFNPQGTLTRGAAAKIICNMILGPTTADALSADTTPFKDVPVSHTFAGYIAYCAQEGIISGYADGTFQPANTLTGYAFMKMLLGALGYDSKVEGYVGANWSVAVAKRALAVGLDEDLEGAFVGSKALTREEACLYAFNTLISTMVEYDNTIIVGDVTIAGSKAKDALHSDNTTVEFYEKYFTKMSLGSKYAEGAVYRTVDYNGKTVADSTVSGTILATSADGTSYANLVSETSTDYIGYKATPDVSGATAVRYFYQDGVINVAVTADEDDDNAVEKAHATNNAGLVIDDGSNADLASFKGVIVNFIDTNDDNKYDIVSYVKKDVVKLAAAPSTKVSGSATQVSIPGVCSNRLSTLIEYPEGLAKDDIVLHYTSANGNIYVYAAEKIDGDTITSYNGSKTVTINGVAYAPSDLTGFDGGSYDTVAELATTMGKPGYTFYVDDGANICYVIEPSATVKMEKTWFVSAVHEDSDFGESTYTAKVIDLNGGTPQIVTVKKTKLHNGTMTPLVAGMDVRGFSNMADGKLADKTFYTYEKNSDGSYNLIALPNQATYGTDLSKGSSSDLDALDESYTVTGKKAQFLSKAVAAAANWNNPALTAQNTTLGTSSTVFAYYDATNKDYDIYTGVANAQSYTAGGTIYVLNDATSNAYAQFVVCEGATSTASTSAYNKVFLTSDPSVTKDADNVDVYTYTAIIDGVLDQTYKTYTSGLNAGELYLVKDYEDGIARSGAELKYNDGGYPTTAVTYYSLHAPTDDKVVNSFKYDMGESALYVNGQTATVYKSDDSVLANLLLASDVVVYLYDNTDSDNPIAMQITPEQAVMQDYEANNATISTVAVSETDATVAAMYIYINNNP